MELRDQVAAIRGSVALARLDHVRYVRFRGDGAYAALDRLCPGDLHVRDGQMLHGLLLGEDGRCFADLYLACDDEEYFLLVEGATGDELDAHLRRYLPRGGGVEVEDVTASHGILELDGPYAWELLGIVANQEAIGLPYLTFFHLDGWICYRAGRTGEYGYGIIAPRADIAGLEQRVREAGRPFDLAVAGLDALDQCALENWFFNIRREGREPVTPIELQLQWRVSCRKTFVGSDALARRRQEGPRVRLTCLVGDGPYAVGEEVVLDGGVVGRVVNAGFSGCRGDWVALALLDIAWAHSGIGAFSVGRGGAAVAARSVSPPVLNNRSLHVSPQLHSYGTRSEYRFPPLPRG